MPMLSIEEIKSYIEPVVEKYPIEKVILFGSYARGDAKETSDVDLVVESGGKMRNIKIFTLGGELLNALPVRVDVYDILEIANPSAMYENIQKEGVIIYEKSTGSKENLTNEQDSLGFWAKRRRKRARFKQSRMLYRQKTACGAILDKHFENAKRNRV